MNDRQWETFIDIVDLCRSDNVGSINVAGKERRDAIIAAHEQLGIVGQVEALKSGEGEGLKPCPFCGNADITSDDIVRWGGYRRCWIQCANCGVHGPDRRGETSAIEAWNSRVDFVAEIAGSPRYD